MERSSSASETNLEAYLENQILRLRRALTFSGELTQALRREFEPLLRQDLPPSLRASEAKFKQFAARVEAVARQVNAGKQMLEAQAALGRREALKLLATFPLTQLIEEAKGLNGLAHELRTMLPAQVRNVPAPRQEPEARKQEGTWMGWLRSLVAPPRVNAVQEPGARSVPALVFRKLQALELALELASKVLDYVAPRMLLIRAGLLAAELPGPQIAKQAIAIGRKVGVPAAQLEWVHPLAEMFQRDPALAQRAQVAENQFKHASELRAEAEILKASLDTASPENAERFLEQFNPARFKGSLMPLSNLHVTFRGVELLGDLFPSPRTGG